MAAPVVGEIVRGIVLGEGGLDATAIVRLASAEEQRRLLQGPREVRLAPDEGGVAIVAAIPRLAPIYVRNSVGEYCRIGVLTELQAAHRLRDSESGFLRAPSRGRGVFELTVSVEGGR